MGVTLRRLAKNRFAALRAADESKRSKRSKPYHLRQQPSMAFVRADADAIGAWLTPIACRVLRIEEPTEDVEKHCSLAFSFLENNGALRDRLMHKAAAEQTFSKLSRRLLATLGRYAAGQEDDEESRQMLAERLLELAEEELGRTHSAALAAAPPAAAAIDASGFTADPAFLRAESCMREKLIRGGLKKVWKIPTSKAGKKVGGAGLDGAKLSEKWLVHLVNGRAGRSYKTDAKSRGMHKRKPLHESDEEMSDEVSDEDGSDIAEGAAEAAAAEKGPRKRRRGFDQRGSAALNVEVQYTCELCGTGMRLTSMIPHRLGPKSCVRHPMHQLNFLRGLPNLVEASKGPFAELARSSSGGNGPSAVPRAVILPPASMPSPPVLAPPTRAVANAYQSRKGTPKLEAFWAQAQ